MRQVVLADHDFDVHAEVIFTSWGQNNTPTPTRQWHDLKVRIAGPKVAAYLDGKLYLEHTLTEPVSGRIGLWSKADSHMYFDDFTVTPAD